MSWINEVKSEIRALELSRKNLKNFGLLIGGIFILISLWITFKNFKAIPVYGFLILGSSLIGFGLFKPNSLKFIYKIWMGISIVLGWFVSRFILTILFFVVITPFGLFLRLVGKKFLDINFNDRRKSYWIIRSETPKIDYKRMY